MTSYSELLVKTIAQLFTKNTEKRPDFNQLYNLLEPYSIKIQKLEPFDYDLKEATRKYGMSPQKHCRPQDFEQVDVEYAQPQKTIYLIQQS